MVELHGVSATFTILPPCNFRIPQSSLMIPVVQGTETHYVDFLLTLLLTSFDAAVQSAGRWWQGCWRRRRRRSSRTG